jgi:hypothetical protein
VVSIFFLKKEKKRKEKGRKREEVAKINENRSF